VNRSIDARFVIGSLESLMKRKRRTRTTIEMREVVVIRSSRKRNRVLCAKCSEAAALVTIEEAVKMSGITARAIYRLIEAGEVHFVETAEGLTLICADTMLARVGKNRTAN
jgi:hypothetical protein